MTIPGRRGGGLPVAATLLTAVMLPVLLGLAYWQGFIRRPWKADLIARLEAAKSLPPLAADRLAATDPAALQYRRATIDCRPGRVEPYDVKGGTSAGDDGGFLVLVACTPHPDVVVVAGWTLRPDKVASLEVNTTFNGTLIARPYGEAAGRPRLMLIPSTAVPPLVPSRPPTPDDLPDNHLSYALQWLAFAITLAVVYVVYLRQWQRTAGAA